MVAVEQLFAERERQIVELIREIEQKEGPNGKAD
jgi:hypothetical protein